MHGQTQPVLNRKAITQPRVYGSSKHENTDHNQQMVYSVQIKRLRHEDPIDALVVRGSKRKRADHDEEDPFVFRLARTYESQQADKHVILESSRPAGAAAEHVFAIAESKRQRRSSGPAAPERALEGAPAESPAAARADGAQLVPAELQSMIAEYINAEKKPASPSPEESDKETEDYVFDVYFSDKAGPVASGNIGYIEIEEGQERLLFGESNSDSDSPLGGDEEDSNAEDYYKNEYPDEDEDEDDDYGAIGRGEGEFGSDLDELLGDKMGDLHLDPEWSEDDEADDEETSFHRYGWR